MRCSGGGSGATEVGEGSTTDGRRVSGEGGEKEMSAAPASHTHTDAKGTLPNIKHTLLTCHKERSPRPTPHPSPPTETGARRDTNSPHTCGVKS